MAFRKYNNRKYLNEVKAVLGKNIFGKSFNKKAVEFSIFGPKLKKVPEYKKRNYNEQNYDQRMLKQNKMESFMDIEKVKPRLREKANYVHNFYTKHKFQN